MNRTASQSGRCRRSPAGFTLVEILLVVAIMALMMSLVVIGVSSSTGSKQVSATADNVASQIAYGRLVAVASGRPTEIRFYLEPVTSGSEEEMFFRSAQVMVTDEQGMLRPSSRVTGFEGRVIINPSEEYSSIVAGAPEPPDPDAAKHGNSACREFEYKAIRFLPDGSTNLAKGGSNYWTITFQTWHPAGNDDLPDNFVTLQVDAFSGKTRRYEPGH